MTSRRDRVVKARMTQRCLSNKVGKCSPGSACRRGIVAPCVLLSLHNELETSEHCLVLLKLTHALILTNALGEYGLTELTSGLQHQA